MIMSSMVGWIKKRKIILYYILYNYTNTILYYTTYLILNCGIDSFYSQFFYSQFLGGLTHAR